ncbi:histone-lysine N-methyltransferase SETMAR [Trichonephila clavipes]|uniref:Histone-lysine N-methyltransferase SETMAR n=1 Tax=Trichonephila clavipes TaxID=2585209 RepID=A0A8X6SCI9_TRICX|nr:histone-lysine N-methyltransferase SETMAR [Trichonephila clavipes]
MACALDFLDRYHKEGDQFLERIVTGDKTWVSHITPESKRQSMERRHTNSPVRVKAKRTISTRKNKRRGLLTSGVLLLHDNTRPHSAINTQNMIRSFGWEQIDHPPYSPDLAPSDFNLFCYLKEFIGGRRFDTADEVKEEVQDWLSSQAADVYDLGIQKLVERYDTHTNVQTNMEIRKGCKKAVNFESFITGLYFRFSVKENSTSAGSEWMGVGAEGE